MSGDWRGDVLRFWFGLDPAQYWKADEDLDQRIRERFLDLWSEKRQLPVDSFVGSALTALAGVILFDQFPRNMFRGHADQFSTDALALAIAGRAVDLGLDRELERDERPFLYMPFEHSEAVADQRRSLLLFTKLGDDRFLDYAKKHQAIIARFARFPHRNQMLGRAPRPDEIAAGDVTPF